MLLAEELPAESTKGHEETVELLCCEDHIDLLLSFLNPQWDRDIHFPSAPGEFLTDPIYQLSQH